MALYRVGILLLGALALLGCNGGGGTGGDSATASTSQVGDTLLLVQGGDTAWIWWSLDRDLDGDGVVDQALGFLASPGIAGDSLQVLWREGSAWSPLGSTVLRRSQVSYLLVSISPAGVYDFAIDWYSSGLPLLRAALPGVRIGAPESSSSQGISSSSLAVVLDSGFWGGSYVKGDTTVEFYLTLGLDGSYTEMYYRNWTLPSSGCAKTTYSGTWLQNSWILSLNRAKFSTYNDCALGLFTSVTVSESISASMEFQTADGDYFDLQVPDAGDWVSLSPASYVN